MGAARKISTQAAAAAGATHTAYQLARSGSGLWLLRDAAGTQSGTFRSREAAIRYVQLISGDRHTPVTILADGLEPGRR